MKQAKREYFPDRHYIRHIVDGDGDCGYTSFGITRKHAHQILKTSYNDQKVKALLLPAVKSALLKAEFFVYCKSLNLIAQDVTIVNVAADLNHYALRDQIVSAYIDYDIKDRCIDGGWAHPGVLQALAAIRGLSLYMWRFSKTQALIPHRIGEEDYSSYVTPNSDDEVHLLFVNNNHFDRIELADSPLEMLEPMVVDDIASQDDESHKQEKSLYKSRLLLGEGDFSFAVSLVRKHIDDCPDLGRAFIATAYDSENVLREKYPNFEENIECLREYGATVLFNVDAQRLHEHPGLKNKIFDAIHFNFPYVSHGLSETLRAFYKSASHMQTVNGRVYMALPKPPNQFKKENGVASNYFYKVMSYNIYDNTRNAGYRLLKKREFGSERYPGYQHVKTRASGSAGVTRFGREYIFLKTNLTADEILRLDNQGKIKPIRWKGIIVPELSTASDSTDYRLEERKADYRLLPIRTEATALEWLDDLNLARKKFVGLKGQSVPLPYLEVRKFIRKLKSLEVYLSGESEKHFYTHPSGLHWKGFVFLWYFRECCHEPIDMTQNKQQRNLIDRYFLLLSNIVEQFADRDNYLVMYALEAMFYLRDYKPDMCVEFAVKTLKTSNMHWQCKVVAASLLKSIGPRKDFSVEKLIHIFLNVIGYDPRMDWLFCSFLGEYGLTQFLMNKKYRGIFQEVSDFRLIKILLSSSKFGKLCDRSNKLPNKHYFAVAKFLLQQKKGEHELCSQVIKSAVIVPQVLSQHFTRDLLSWKCKVMSIAICQNIFMPANSVMVRHGRETIQGILKDRHQFPSFLKLAKNYSHGENGCYQSDRKALGYYRLTAMEGDIGSLMKIMEFFARAKVDVSKEDPRVWLDYCVILQKTASLSKQQKSAVLVCRAIIELLSDNFDKAMLAANLSLNFNPQNHYAQFVMAVLYSMNRQFSSARDSLEKIHGDQLTLKKHIILLIEMLDDPPEKLTRDWLLSQLQECRGEQIGVMGVYMGLILDKLSYDDRAADCFQWIVEIWPDHFVANKWLIEKAGSTPRRSYYKSHPYDLVLRNYESMTLYLNDKQVLQAKASSLRGFIVCIGGLSNIQVMYLTPAKSHLIEDPEILEVVEKVLSVQLSENQRVLEDAMTVLHQFVTLRFKVSATACRSFQIDECESIGTFSAEQVRQIEESSVPQSATHQRGLFDHGQSSSTVEQDDPEDSDHSENAGATFDRL